MLVTRPLLLQQSNAFAHGRALDLKDVAQLRLRRQRLINFQLSTQDRVLKLVEDFPIGGLNDNGTRFHFPSLRGLWSIVRYQWRNPLAEVY